MGLVGQPHATSDFFDPIKYLRLTKRREHIFLSIGGETRQYLEFFQNELWGSTGDVDNVSWLQGYMLHAELRLTRYVRLFVLEMACFAAGRRGREVPRVDGNPHYRPYRHHRGGQLAGVRVAATRVPAEQERRSLSFQSNKWEV